MHLHKFISCFVFFSAPILGGSARDPSALQASTLGLPRHDSGKSTVESPTASPQARDRNGVKYLALDAGRDWSRPLRGKKGDRLYVSLALHASLGTTLALGPARLSVQASELSGYAKLAVESLGVSRDLGLHIALEKFSGQSLATLDVLTVRLDPANNTFDLYQGAILAAEDLPLDPASKDNDKIVIRPGPGGAMLMGLVQSDDNPLYADANANGVDDDFEQSKKGRLLASAAAAEERKALAAEWREHQQRNPSSVPALFVATPRPDGK
jgi:hypothetical protein